jgi:hypothetical protein
MDKNLNFVRILQHPSFLTKMFLPGEVIDLCRRRHESLAFYLSP